MADYNELLSGLIKEELSNKDSTVEDPQRNVLASLIPMAAGVLTGQVSQGGQLGMQTYKGLEDQRQKSRGKLLDYLAKLKGKESDKVITKNMIVDGVPRTVAYNESDLAKGIVRPTDMGQAQIPGNIVVGEDGTYMIPAQAIGKRAESKQQIVQDENSTNVVTMPRGGGDASVQKVKGIGGKPRNDKVTNVVTDAYGNSHIVVVDKGEGTSKEVTSVSGISSGKSQKAGIYGGPAVVAEVTRLDRDLESNVAYKNAKEMTEKAENAIAMLEARSPVGDANAGFTLARTFQGAGLITDQDYQIAAGGNRAWFERAKQAIQEIKTGNYTESNRDLYINLAKLAHDRAARTMNGLVEGQVKSIETRFPRQEREAEGQADIYRRSTISKRRELFETRDRAKTSAKKMYDEKKAAAQSELNAINEALRKAGIQ